MRGRSVAPDSAERECPSAGEIFVLGSGRSILDLSREEVDYMNRAESRIALNKFMAFYKKSGILPTHVHYLDAQPSAKQGLQYIFEVCRRGGISDITFILNRDWSKRLATSRLTFLLKKMAVRVLRKTDLAVFLAPRGCHYQWVCGLGWLRKDKQWAQSLDDPLYNFRSGLTAVLNYISIVHTGKTIKLVGVDLNSPEYFFQEELDALKWSWADWSTSLQVTAELHTSALTYKGTTIFDRLDFIVEQILRSGNRLVCCNPKSLLVTKGNVPFAPVIEDKR